MLCQFLNVLLQVLLVKSHDLLQEEITVMLYNMAAVDFDTFYSQFLPQLVNNCDGLDENQRTILSCNFSMDKVGIKGTRYKIPGNILESELHIHVDV